MFQTRNILLFFIILISLKVRAEEIDTIKSIRVDTIISKNVGLTKKIKSVLKSDSTNLKTFKPDPIKSVWMGAIIPGYGQILNKKYWKLPIIYGGFLGCAYAIAWNSGTYNTYLTAYQDIISNNPSQTSYLQIIPKGYTLADLGGISGFTNILNTKQQIFHRYRDLSIIVTVGLYALTLVDAYVDAQLYDFDISPDLSMHIQPTLLQNTSGSPNTFAMQCSFRLK